MICTFSVSLYANKAEPVFYPHGYVPSLEAWAEPSVPFQFGSNGLLYYASRFTSPVMVPSASLQKPRVVEMCRKRSEPRDSSILVAFNRYIPPPPSLTIFANDRSVASIAYSKASGEKDLALAEVRIPDEFQHDKEVSFRIQSESGSWTGGVLFLPSARTREFFAWFLFPAFLTGMFLSCWVFAKRTALHLITLGVLAFTFYYSWNFPLKTIPLDAFFSDSKELVDIIRFNVWDFDMQKHVLFLPVIRILAGVSSLLTAKPLRILSIAFSLIAAANIVLAAASIRRCGLRRSHAGLLTALYGGCFSIITYSSIFETYIFSSLVVNTLLFASLLLAHAPSKRIAMMAAVFCGFLPLATWQLAAFMPVFIVWHAHSLFKWKPAYRVILGHCAIVVAAFAIGYKIVWALYAGPLGAAGDSTSRVLERTAEAYVRLENLNADTCRQVLLDTFVTSLINAEQPAVVTASLRASRLIRGGAIALSFILCLAGMLGLFTLRGSRLILALIGAAGFLAYIGFHWWFNPVEMLLYTPPIMLLWLLPFSDSLARTRLGTKVGTPLLVALLLLQLTCVTLVSRPFQGSMPSTGGDQTVSPVRWGIR
jgi:hypothetical protein